MNTLSSPSQTADRPIAVAISGGADSLHTLVSLKQQNTNLMAVHGLFGQNILTRFIQHAGLPSLSPSPDQLVERMRRLCDTLDVPFHLINCEEQFLNEVVKPFITTYAQGGTPNPCALCNAAVKLGSLLHQSMALGAQQLATGHYARLVTGEQGPLLLQGEDPKKDQSYFLALTPLTQLTHVIFPIGGKHKSHILAELDAWGMTPPQQGESQEVCFIPGNMYREFLPFMAAELGISLPGKGRVLLEDNTCLGTHQGLWQYTEGQRRGLGIGWKEPLHVLAKEQENNILRVGPKAAGHTSSFSCDISNLLINPQLWPEIVLVKSRYREQPQQAAVTLTYKGDIVSMQVHYLTPHSTVSCGQLAALYIPYKDGSYQSLCLAAGGVITHTTP